MKYRIGDRVSMLRTAKVGTVAEVMGDNLYRVRLDGGMGELPIPGEALEAAAPEGGPRREAKNATENNPVAPSPPAARAEEADTEPEAAGQYDTGVQVAFAPNYDGDGQPVDYQLYLINGTRHRLVYDLQVLTGDQRRQSKAAQLAAYDRVKLDTVPYGWLNERLAVALDVRTLHVDGTGPRNFQQLRIRGKQFFKNLRDTPELNREAHRYTVFPTLRVRGNTAPAPAPPSLRQVTKDQLAARPTAKPERQTGGLSLQDRTEFEEVLDLHLPALVSNPAAVPKHQVLSTQLMYLDQYLDRAVRLGVDRVFIIHGVGNGVLKREVHKRLRYMPYVRKYRNDYHHKYAYGATEVTFD